jgi:hypothetical protein
MVRPAQLYPSVHPGLGSGEVTTGGVGLAVPDGMSWGEAVFLAAVAAVPVIGGPLVVLLQKTIEDDDRRTSRYQGPEHAPAGSCRPGTSAYFRAFTTLHLRF